MAGDFATFLIVSAVVIVTPGPDTLLTIRNTLLGGRTSGLCTVCGVVTGQATWAIATSLGLATLLVASEPAFVALKLAGAAYLLYLGVQSLRSALWPGAQEHVATVPRSGSRIAPPVALRQGLISNLGNPKMAVFFPSLLPQFTQRHEASFSALLLLGLVFCLLTFAWLTGYAVAVARANDLLRRARVRRALDALMGVALVALGVRLATARR